MHKLTINLTGQRFGKLKVISHAGHIHKSVAWLWSCDCGKEKIIKSQNLRSGRSNSCGHCLSYKVEGDLVTGIDSRGRQFYFDYDDFDCVKQYRWHVNTEYVAPVEHPASLAQYTRVAKTGHLRRTGCTLTRTAAMVQ